MKNYLPAIFTMIAIVCMNTLSFAQNSVVLNLELTNTSTSTDFMFMEVYIETSPAYIVGNEGPNPNNPVPLFIGGTTMTTSLTFDENTEDIELFLTQVCSDNMGAVETTTIPPVTLSYNGELDPSGNVTIDYTMELSCGEGGEAYWDCPNLMGNVGDYCQNGWGTINENCECIVTEENCLTDSEIDYSNLFLYYLLQCSDDSNLEAWIYCGLMESLDDAFYGNTEACEEIQNWIDINNWDGTWTPGNDELTWTYGDDVTLICNGDMYDDTPITITSEEYDNPEEMDSDSNNMIDQGEFIWYLADLYDCYSFNVATIINWENIYINGEQPNWDCPEQEVNYFDYCILNNGEYGFINENCECEANVNCNDFQIFTNVLAADDGEGNGIVEVIAYGGVEPYSYAWEGWSFDIIGTSSILENCVAGEVYWVAVTDGNGCVENSYIQMTGTGENQYDCPDLGGNIGEWCTTNNLAYGEINEDCECVEIQGCNDFEVSTILLSNDDGTGNGSVEAIVSGGTPPYSYAWEAWSWDVIGTNAILENCEAGTYFVQVTDDNGCVVFGNVEVLLDTDVNTEECVAEFNIGQAFSDNEIIPFELFVYVFGYDEANEYFWSFGDEGTSTDPFPTWTYETNGPYQLCLTVSNEENDCSETYCETIEVDSLGWIFGIQDGFTITIMNGDLDSVNDITDLSHHSIINIYPNPVNNNLTVNTNEIGDFEFIVTSLTGQTLLKTSITNSKVHRFDVSKLCSGMYILNITSGDLTESRTFVINR